MYIHVYTMYFNRCIPACRVNMNGLVKCNMCIDQCTCSIQNVIDGNFCVVFCHPESLFSSEKGRILINSFFFSNLVKGVFIDECHVFDKWLVQLNSMLHLQN